MKILRKLPGVSNEKGFNIPVIKKKEKETRQDKNLQTTKSHKEELSFHFIASLIFKVRAEEQKIN